MKRLPILPPHSAWKSCVPKEERWDGSIRDLFALHNSNMLQHIIIAPTPSNERFEWVEATQIVKRDLVYGKNWCTASIIFNLSIICCHWNLMWTELALGGQIDFINCKSTLRNNKLIMLTNWRHAMHAWQLASSLLNSKEVTSERDIRTTDSLRKYLGFSLVKLNAE